MTTDAMPATATYKETRPLYWSVRRELWENRSIYLAPIIVAAIVLFANFISMAVRLPHRVRGLSGLASSRQLSAITTQYGLAASMILFSGFIVALFYCIDALNSERRDRSILFWKSLPVSDRITVLAKASIPLLVLPVITYAVALVTQGVMAMMGTVIVAAHGINPILMWAQLPLVRMSVIMFYGLFAHVLWYAPIYAWLLLLSAWSKRATALWVLLPLFGILFIEQMAFGTRYFISLVMYRMSGAMTAAFTVNAAKADIGRLSQLAPLKFLTTPGLWAGLAFAALCLAAAVRLRRNREPI
jgi:ABC-2 type transport system permease protein